MVCFIGMVLGKIGITSVCGFIDCMNNLGDFLFSLDFTTKNAKILPEEQVTVKKVVK